MTTCNLHDYKTVIFDFDGTLIDSMPFWDTLVLSSFEDYQLDSDPHFLEILPTLSVVESADYISSHHAKAPRPQILMADWETKIQKAFNQTLELKSGALELVRQLSSRGVKLAIATMSQRRIVAPAASRLGLLEYIPTLVTIDDVSVGKHEPEIWHEVLRQIGTAVEDTAVVEDAYFAARTAKQAGFFVVGVADNANASLAEPMQAMVDCYIQDLNELILK